MIQYKVHAIMCQSSSWQPEINRNVYNTVRSSLYYKMLDFETKLIVKTETYTEFFLKW